MSQDMNNHPTLLAVNREARYETLKSYAMIHGEGGFWLAFNSRRDVIRNRITDWEHHLLRPCLLYDTDGLETLCVSNRSLRIRRIAVDERIVESMGKRHGGLEERVDLEEIFIVLSPSAVLK